MGRPVKQGLNYFPKDVDFYNDYKIMDLLENHGPVGITVYDIVLCEVLRNGYYLAASIDKLSANVVRIIGSKWVQKRLVSQVILDCGDLGLFETTLLAHGVITSVGIQRRYATVTARNKTKKEEYWLIDENGQPLLDEPKTQISGSEIEVSGTETAINVEVIPQKESKENKRKENKNNVVTYVHDEKLNQAILDFVEYRKEIRKPMTERATELLVHQLEKMASDHNIRIAILNQSIVNGWQGIFPLKEQEKKQDQAGRKKNQFHNFEQRDTNYDAIVLERLNERLGGQE